MGGSIVKSTISRGSGGSGALMGRLLGGADAMSLSLPNDEEDEPAKNVGGGGIPCGGVPYICAGSIRSGYPCDVASSSISSGSGALRFRLLDASFSLNKELGEDGGPLCKTLMGGARVLGSSLEVVLIDGIGGSDGGSCEVGGARGGDVAMGSSGPPEGGVVGGKVVTEPRNRSARAGGNGTLERGRGRA